MHSFADSEETLNIVAMDNKFSQTHYSFKFVRTYMEMLEQLTLKALLRPVREGETMQGVTFFRRG